MTFPIVVLILGAVLLLIGALGRVQIQQFSAGTDSKAIRTTLAIAGMSLVIYSFVLFRYDPNMKMLPTGKPDNQKQIIVIASPKNNENVQREIQVSGTHRNIPPDEVMFLYVYPMDEGKYYLTEIWNRYDKEFWEVEPVIIGSESNERGNIFKLGVLLVSNEVSKDIRSNQHALEYGLVVLPQGTKFSEIYISRK